MVQYLQLLKAGRRWACDFPKPTAGNVICEVSQRSEQLNTRLVENKKCGWLIRLVCAACNQVLEMTEL
jgi:hypothetical protein